MSKFPSATEKWWWKYLHPAKYRKGMKFYHGMSNKEFVIQEVELNPGGWTYLYDDRFACGEAHLELECHLQNSIWWEFNFSWRHFWVGLYSEGGETYPYRKDYWLAIPFVALHIVHTGERSIYEVKQDSLPEDYKPSRHVL